MGLYDVYVTYGKSRSNPPIKTYSNLNMTPIKPTSPRTTDQANPTIQSLSRPQ